MSAMLSAADFQRELAVQLPLFDRGIVVRHESIDAADEPAIEKRCRVCGGTYRAVFFPPRRATCRGCLQTARDRQKWRDRFLPKVQWARRTHARRLHMPARELRLGFGWTDDRMAADARRVWHEGCPSCGRVLAYRPAWLDWPDERVAEAYLGPPAFETSGARAKEIYPYMGMSLCELILRIVDRSAPPWYGTNTRWCCTFCRAVDDAGRETDQQVASHVSYQPARPALLEPGSGEV